MFSEPTRSSKVRLVLFGDSFVVSTFTDVVLIVESCGVSEISVVSGVSDGTTSLIGLGFLFFTTFLSFFVWAFLGEVDFFGVGVFLALCVFFGFCVFFAALTAMIGCAGFDPRAQADNINDRAMLPSFISYVQLNLVTLNLP